MAPTLRSLGLPPTWTRASRCVWVALLPPLKDGVFSHHFFFPPQMKWLTRPCSPSGTTPECCPSIVTAGQYFFILTVSVWSLLANKFVHQMASLLLITAKTRPTGTKSQAQAQPTSKPASLMEAQTRTRMGLIEIERAGGGMRMSVFDVRFPWAINGVIPFVVSLYGFFKIQ